MSYRLDHAEISRLARDVFDVRYPVEVRRRKRYYTDPSTDFNTIEAARVGRHCFWLRRQVHDIVLVSQMDWVEALQTLAHELRHAWQCEQYVDGDAWSAAYLSCQAAFEADAERAGIEHWHDLTPAISFPSRLTRTVQSK